MTSAIHVEGLVKRYGSEAALAGVSLAVPPGAVVGMLGPNGAGKTTLVRVLATLVRPDAGTALVAGLDVVRQAARVRRLIGLTGQDTSVDEDLTGAENLELLGRLLDLRRAQVKRRAAQLLDEFGLAGVAGRRVATYSGGMRRRLDLAASLVGEPRVVFLDEPTTGLDPAKREEVWRMVRAMAGGGVTVLLTTQYLEEAEALCDEVTVIDHGRVLVQDTPARLKRRVGGRTIVAQPEDPGRVAEAAAILAGVTGREPESTGGVLRVPAGSDAALAEVAQRLGAAGIGVLELSLRLPGLDEVFFTLTGRPAAGAREAAEVAAR
jgi:oleandomycin transport system ATP-binding protein